VFCYLLGTHDLALTYGRDWHKLQGYTNADGASQEYRHPVSGHVFLIDGSAVSWSSHKQELITLSIAEAECVAAMHTSKELMWLCHLIGDLSHPPLTATTLLCDNQAAIRLAQADNYHACMKHIDICYHFICDMVKHKEVSLMYCPTNKITTDILTKVLPHWKVTQHSLSLRLGHPCGGVLESEGLGALRAATATCVMAQLHF